MKEGCTDSSHWIDHSNLSRNIIKQKSTLVEWERYQLIHKDSMLRFCLELLQFSLCLNLLTLKRSFLINHYFRLFFYQKLLILNKFFNFNSFLIVKKTFLLHLKLYFSQFLLPANQSLLLIQMHWLALLLILTPLRQYIVKTY